MMRDDPNTSFGLLKQNNAGLLNVGYAEAGKSDGPAVVLLTVGSGPEFSCLLQRGARGSRSEHR